MVYVSPDEIKAHSQITYKDFGLSSDSAFTAFISTIIPEVESLISHYTHTPETQWSGETATMSFYSGGVGYSGSTALYYDYYRPRVVLHTAPILNFYLAEMNFQGYGCPPIWKTLPTNYYVLDSEKGLIYFHVNVPAMQEHSIRLSYKTGYLTPPDDIKLAVNVMVSNYLQALIQRKVNNIVSVKDMSIKLVMPEVFTDDVIDLLNDYRFQKFGTG